MSELPKHIVIIMDGNGRWAQQRNLPRSSGHQAGVKTTRKIVEHCARLGVSALTVYAFSSENWRRPEKEVSFLMELFLRALKSEVDKLHKNNIVVQFIGEIESFPENLQRQIIAARDKTAGNNGMRLNDGLEPDLFIRTGGDHRLSNYLLWHLAYTELVFTKTLWPDFDDSELDLAVESYMQRQRRFGQTGEQIMQQTDEH